MDGQGTEDHVKALRREWGLRHIPPDIGHLRSRGLFPGHGQHFLRQVHAGDRRRAVFRRIDAVPAVAAAQIQYAAAFQRRKHPAELMPFSRSRKPLSASCHLRIFIEKMLVIIFVFHILPTCTLSAISV